MANAAQTRPRVLVWTTGVLPPTQTFVRNQTDAMRRYDVTLAGAMPKESAIRRKSDRSLYGPGLWQEIRARATRETFAGPRFTQLLDDVRPDLVHIHFATEAAYLGPVLARLGIPYVVTAHGYDVTTRMTGRSPLTRWRRWRTSRALRRAARVVAVSHHIAHQVSTLGAVDNVVVRHIGIPLPSSAGAHPREGLALVGRLVEKKGVRDLLDACELLGDRCPPVKVIGDGPLRRELVARAASSGLPVDFLGYLEPADVAAQMASVVALVVPSRTSARGDTEGLPTVLLEAGALGTPCIATRHAGIPEALDDETGILVDEGDVRGIADAIDRLTSDAGLARRLGAAARQRMLSSFDIATCTARIEDVYDEVLRGEPG